MKHRLLLQDTQTPVAIGDLRPIEGDPARYLARVLRLKPGAELGLFDGRGREWLARLTGSSPRRCEAEIIEEIRSEPPPRPLVLVQSWLKGAAMDTVVQKATELGVSALWIIGADRSAFRPDAERSRNKLAHLERVLISAAQQCETLWLPELVVLEDLAAALSRQPEPGTRRIMLEPGQPALVLPDEPCPLMVLVGPEGGWSERERTLAESAGSLMVMGLGELILRAETVPLAVLAAVRHGWGWRR
jgi:16S rRNA (uracil1498-N3)-methyltransferase